MQHAKTDREQVLHVARMRQKKHADQTMAQAPYRTGIWTNVAASNRWPRMWQPAFASKRLQYPASVLTADQTQAKAVAGIVRENQAAISDQFAYITVPKPPKTIAPENHCETPRH